MCLCLIPYALSSSTLQGLLLLIPIIRLGKSLKKSAIAFSQAQLEKALVQNHADGEGASDHGPEEAELIDINSLLCNGDAQIIRQ